MDPEFRMKHYASVVRCYKIIKQFVQLEDVPEKLRNDFTKWLFVDAQTIEKQIAMDIVTYESSRQITEADVDRLLSKAKRETKYD